ncbi:MAG: glycosyltransferase [Phascolarctobacterium sp.]|nr:glycosyltransferase [Phascolarctobacterium sp.]
MKPKVSVLTPVYNTNPEYLRECIDSILNQTFTDFEFLILNDSPENDELEKFILEYEDKRIKYFKNEKNIGISKSRNKLVELAQGEYLAIFDHDDVSLSDRLTLEVEYLDSHPDVGMVSGWDEFFGIDNRIRKYPEHDAQIKRTLVDHSCVNHTAAMIRKSILIDNNIHYEEEYSPAEDYMLFVRLMAVTNFYNFQKVLVRYRTYEQNTSNTQNVKMANAAVKIRCFAHNCYPAYWEDFVHSDDSHRTFLKVYLLGIFPLFKIRNNWVYLFNFIPIIKLRWKGI